MGNTSRVELWTPSVPTSVLIHWARNPSSSSRTTGSRGSPYPTVMEPSGPALEPPPT